MKFQQIDSIPPELCDGEEAAKILGLTKAALFYKVRFGKLRFATVYHNGAIKYLYNRKEIERYKYPPRPEGYYDSKEAAECLGFNRADTAVTYMRKMNVPRMLIKASHPYYLYKIEDVKELRRRRLKKKYNYELG